MPLTDHDPNRQAIAEPVASAGPTPWHRKLSALLLVIFCFELGVFLLVFPWISSWEMNYFSDLPPALRGFWSSPYLKGAISGLGVVNIYISFLEMSRLRRLANS